MGFIRIYNGGKLIREVELTEPRLTIGRTQDNDIVLNESGVSRLHAVITKSEKGVFIEDTDSRNGVFLNKKPVKYKKLSFWDEIQIHNYVIKYMALEGLVADGQEETPTEKESDFDSTIFMALSDEKQLDKLRNKTRKAYITYQENGTQLRQDVTGLKFTFGRSGQSNIKIRGWLNPSIAATIEKQGSQFYIKPAKRGKVVVGGDLIKTSTPIKDGMGFVVRNREFKFFYRLTEK